MNSNRKGKVGERELAKILREYGYDCRRTQQYAGKVEDSADIVGLPYIHIECKRVQALNIDNAMSQAIRDCQDRLPTVFHRKKQFAVACDYAIRGLDNDITYFTASCIYRTRRKYDITRLPLFLFG